MSGELAAVDSARVLYEVRYEKTIEEVIKALRAGVAEEGIGKQHQTLIRTITRWGIALVAVSGTLTLLITTPRPWTSHPGSVSLLIGVAILGLALAGIWAFSLLVRPDMRAWRMSPVLRAHERAYRTGKRSAYLGPCVIRLTEAGIESEAAGERGTLAWSQVVGIKRDDQHMVIRLLYDRFIAIPLAAFADTTQAEAFFNTVRDRATGGQPAPVSSVVASESA